MNTFFLSGRCNYCSRTINKGPFLFSSLLAIDSLEFWGFLWNTIYERFNMKGRNLRWNWYRSKKSQDSDTKCGSTSVNMNVFKWDFTLSAGLTLSAYLVKLSRSFTLTNNSQSAPILCWMQLPSQIDMNSRCLFRTKSHSGVINS